MPRHDTIPSLFHGKRYLIRTTKYGGYVATCPKMEGWGGTSGVHRGFEGCVSLGALPRTPWPEPTDSGTKEHDGRFAGNKCLYDGM